MSVRTPSRRLLQNGGLQCLHSPSLAPPPTPTHTSRRSIWNFFSKGKQSTNAGARTNPVLDEYLKNRNPKDRQAAPKRGDLANTSIFEQDRQVQEREEKEQKESVGEEEGARNPRTMATILDPHPAARERWQRKMLIRDIRKGGRLTKEIFTKRTEREVADRSHNIKTSVKKLGMVARQIAGKTVDDAIVQLRFSKKKAAGEVLEYLEYARDHAVVSRGMGLGLPTVADAVKAKPQDIQLKDGSRHTVSDPTKIYIDQAWVGRGPYGKMPEYRAKGKTNILRTPWTHIGMILKEEATRVRQYNDREDKRRRQREAKVWVPLPDRPIQGQRQWYSW